MMGTGTAAAEVEVPMTRCFGLSPYILDQPYAPGRVFTWQPGPGHTQVSVTDASSLWFFAGGYRSDVRMEWHNTTTGTRGTEQVSVDVGYPGNGVARFDVHSGAGHVEFTISAVNSIPLWSIHTTSCGGSFDVV